MLVLQLLVLCLGRGTWIDDFDGKSISTNRNRHEGRLCLLRADRVLAQHGRVLSLLPGLASLTKAFIIFLMAVSPSAWFEGDPPGMAATARM